MKNNFVIRYGPAAIFSNEIPGLDANFINPKYTESDPYRVSKIPGYTENSERTDALEDIKKSDMYELDELLKNILSIAGEQLNDSTKNDIRIMLISDGTDNNEYQLQIIYKDEFIIIEGGNNDVSDQIYKFIKGEERPNWGASAIEEYAYDSFTQKSEYNEIIKQAVKNHKDMIWTTRLSDKETIEDHLAGGDGSRVIRLNSQEEADKKIESVKRQYGYSGTPLYEYEDQPGDSGSDGQLYKHVSWDTEEDGQKVCYELQYRTADLRSGDVNLYYILYKSAYGGYSTGETKVSTAYELRNTISKWYKALRAIALVGLLSVLVYVGIRILISSTGQEKAKYKKMIIDWFAAICILFILHYIMAFTMIMVEQLSNIFIKGNLIGPNGEDILMSSIRSGINTSGQLSQSFTDLLIYLVLVIYTVIFTIHYLKRLVYLAFFTMIAPLIALTYPLDKIKDGQAQAFGMWLKEYIFNALMPVMHLLLYSIFVGSAMDFARSNPIYALVCIGFMIPAEKFFRKMFGFDKATTSGQLGAAAGGAMVMNAINKISSGAKGSGGKLGKSGEGSSGGAGSSPTMFNPAPGGTNPTPDPTSPFGGTGNTSIPNIAGGDGVNPSTHKPKRSIKGVGKGIANVGKHYFNTANARKLASSGLKGLGRGIRKGAVGAAGAAALGTFGLAAGIATGDLGNVAKYTAGAAGVGFMGANKVGDKLTEVEKKNRDLYSEGRLGTTEFKTRNAIRQLQQDNDFNQMCKQLGINNASDRTKLIRQFSNNQITDPESIKKAVFAGTTSDKVKGQGEDGINTMMAAAKIRQQAKEQGMSRKDVKELLQQRGVSGTNIDDTLNLIYSM